MATDLSHVVRASLEAARAGAEAARAGFESARVAFRTAMAPAVPQRTRGYQGARGQGGRNRGWLANNDDANTILHMDNRTLRARARDLTRNNHHASGAVEKFVTECVGTGIRPSCNTGDVELDRRVDALWERHAARTTAYQQQFVAVWQVFEVGEVLMRRLPLRYGEAEVPVDYQLLEVDHLDESADGWVTDSSGKRVGKRILGVHVDNGGRRRSYRLFREHPGARLVGSGWEAVDVPAGDVAHVYRMTRPGQMRGVTRLAPVIQALADLGDGADAERVRRKLEACLFAFVIDGDPETDPSTAGVDGIAPAPGTDARGNPLERFQPGMIAHLRGNKTIEKVQPATVGGYREYKQTELEGVASGLNMPYPLLTGDLTAVNFSSGRMGLIQFRSAIAVLQQHFLVPLLCVPQWQWFVDAAIVAGQIPDRDYPCDWTTPLPQEVDRGSAAKADAQEMANGTRSRTDIIRSTGRNPERVWAEMAREAERLAELGLGPARRK